MKLRLSRVRRETPVSGGTQEVAKVSLRPKEPFWKDLQGPWAFQAWGKLRDHPPSRPPSLMPPGSCVALLAACNFSCKMEVLLEFLSPHLPFFFMKLFSFLFFFETQQNDQSSVSIISKSRKLGGKFAKEIHKSEDFVVVA